MLLRSVCFLLLACGLFVTRSAQADDAWQATRNIAAPEAHQAAAADEHFFYAISSTQVAKYDRKSGERVAVSSGEAFHLNSGFLHGGKLFCAHSNYPKTPEQSEVFALDLSTMKLTPEHDFGNFGGSLTWVVWHDGHWWCNFAKYGKANSETFLVKFNDRWQEQARWTYPAELIQQLGTYSLSGGVWHGDELLVTGHDDPVVFRLRLPKQGTVLELLGKQAVPFSGQGLAHDPVTGGLIGIVRSKRQLILAERPGPQARP